MGSVLLAGGLVIDPAQNFGRVCDVYIVGERITNVGNISGSFVTGEVIDCTGQIVCPGFIDMHVHARTPGQEHKETLGSVSLAAVMGGITTIICMANTNPVIDNVDDLQRWLVVMECFDLVKIHQVSAVTMGLAGHDLVDLLAMKKMGAIAASDDGKGIQNPEILLEAMKKAKEYNLPLLLHCQDRDFDTYDPQAEIHQAAMSIQIAEKFNLAIHLQHVSTAQTVQLVREAKTRGVQVTCETAPHYFSLTSEDFERIGANAKMNPPLRTKQDVEAVIAGLIDGTIDVIATDHAPHTPEEKSQPLKEAPFGIIGLETAIPVIFTVLGKRLDLKNLVGKLTHNPAKILDLKDKGTLRPGSLADITVIDPNLTKKVEAEKFQSMSGNCPWNEENLTGWPVLTMVGGKIRMKNGELNI